MDTNTYKCVKLKLFDVLTQNEYDKEYFLTVINDTIRRENALMMHLSYFVRMYLIYLYDLETNCLKYPEMNENFLTKCLRIVSGTYKNKNDELYIFYENHYENIENYKKETLTNINSILRSSINAFKTNIVNNIQLHFEKYIKSYIEINLNNYIEINNLEEPDFKKEVYNIKKYIIENKNPPSQYKYLNFVLEHKLKIVPEGDLNINLKNNPHMFIPYQIFIIRSLEKFNVKLYQFFPIKNSTLNNFVSINNDAFVDAISLEYTKPICSNKKKFKDSELDYYKKLWGIFFNFDHKIFKSNSQFFAYSFSTNGYEISLKMIHKDYVNELNHEKAMKRKGRNDFNKNTAGMPPEKKQEFRNNIKKEKKTKQDSKNIADLEKSKQYKKEFAEKIKSIKFKYKNVISDTYKENGTTIYPLGHLFLNFLVQQYNYENNVFEPKNIDTIDYVIIREHLKFKFKLTADIINIILSQNFMELVNNIETTDIELCKNINNWFLRKTELKNLLKLLRIEIFEKKEKEYKFEIKNLKNRFEYSEKDIEKIYSEVSTELLNVNITIEKKKKRIKKYKVKKKHKPSKTYKNIKILKKQCEKLVKYHLKSDFEKYKKIIEELKTKFKKSKKIQKLSDDHIKNLELISKKIRTLKSTKKQGNIKPKHQRTKELDLKINNLLLIKKNLKNRIKKLFQYKNKNYISIDDLTPMQLEILKKYNWVVIDPGKKTLLTMLGKDGKNRKDKKRFTYSNKQRLYKTRRLLYTEKLNKLKERLEIKKLEKELVTFSSKTCDFKKFKQYVIKKLEILKELKRLYNSVDTFYKMKRFGYINKKRENDRLINTIKKEFGEDVILIYGDWSNKMSIKGISTPNNEIKKLLTSNFITLEIDEYKTSKIHYGSGTVTKNYIRKFKPNYLNKKLKEKINIIKENNEKLYKKITKDYKLHSVLVYKETEKLGNKEVVKSSGCINRDTNATLNMKAIVENYLSGKGRLKQFRR